MSGYRVLDVGCRALAIVCMHACMCLIEGEGYMVQGLGLIGGEGYRVQGLGYR